TRPGAPRLRAPGRAAAPAARPRSGRIPVPSGLPRARPAGPAEAVGDLGQEPGRVGQEHRLAPPGAAGERTTTPAAAATRSRSAPRAAAAATAPAAHRTRPISR